MVFGFPGRHDQSSTGVIRNLTAPNVMRRSSNWSWHFELVPWALDYDYLIGLAITALAPALFWPALLKLASMIFGFSISGLALVATGIGIFFFLSTIYTLIVRNR